MIPQEGVGEVAQPAGIVAMTIVGKDVRDEEW